MLCASYLRNRLPIATNDFGASPYELRYKKLPDLRILRPFGVKCVVLKHQNTRRGNKVKGRGYNGIMVGYGTTVTGQKGYRVFLPDRNKVVTAPNVLFNSDIDSSIQDRTPDLVFDGDLEGLLGLESQQQPGNFESDQEMDGDTTTNGHPNGHPTGQPTPDTEAKTTNHAPTEADDDGTDLPPKFGNVPDWSPKISKSSADWSSEPIETPDIPTKIFTTGGAESDCSEDGPDVEHVPYIGPSPTQSPHPMETNGRVKYPAGYDSLPIDDPFFNKPHVHAPLTSKAGDSEFVGGVRRSKRIRNYTGDTNCAYIHKLETSTILDPKLFEAAVYADLAKNPLLFATDVRVPGCFKEALEGTHAEQWARAIKSEVQSLRDLGVFNMVKREDLPPKANVISGKWVFKVKPTKDGHIERFKCRLCARGFLQKFGIDYQATFSPVAHPASIKLLLAIAAKRGLKLRASDISTAFLYGDLPESERVYMEPSPGIDHEPGHVMELRKCIYGLKQASRRWFEKLQGILNRAGYRPTKADPCLYVKNTGKEFTMITVVVDDLLIASDTDTNADQVIQELRKAGLKVKDLGFPEYIIGIHVNQNKQGNISMNQKLYIETILARFNMEDCVPSRTPADPKVVLRKSMGASSKDKQDLMDCKPYRSLVGALLYAVLTRPDIAVAVNELCKHLANPGPTMWTAAKRVL